MGQQAAERTLGGMRLAEVPDDQLVALYEVLQEGYLRTDHRVRDGLVTGVDLPGPWFEVLLRLLRAPGHRLPMTRLAHEVSLTSGGFTKLADRMVRAGLIDRQPCTSDRRVTYTVLTPRGVSTAEEGRRRHAALLRRHLLAPLGADGAERLGELMRRLRDANGEPLPRH